MFTSIFLYNTCNFLSVVCVVFSAFPYTYVFVLFVILFVRSSCSLLVDAFCRPYIFPLRGNVE